MGRPHTMYTYMVNNLEVCDLKGLNVVTLPKVYTKDELPVSRSHIPTQDDINRWPHLSVITLPQVEAGIGLLLGNNIPDAYTPLVVKTGPKGTPHATCTRLGWVVWNVMRDTDNLRDGTRFKFAVNRVEVTAIEQVEELKKLDRLVRHAINCDFPERVIDDKKQPSHDDQRFLEKVNSTIRLEDGHYVIALPFKSDTVHVPADNHTQALHRLMNLKNKLKRNELFHKDYKDFMEKIEEKNYAERVPHNEMSRDDGKVWFIPHHGVYHPRKPEKIRVVFDCTAMYQGTSLNNLLLQGPDLTSSLIGVLLRFRQQPVAIMGDIEAMFYQVRVPREDRDMLRFYWWPNGDLHTDPVVYRMCVHLFGAVSSPSCSTAALHQTADDHRDLFDSQVVDVVKKVFYVDDCLKSVFSEKEAIDLIADVSALCLKGGFHLTKWISNDHAVVHSIPLDERTKDVKTIDLKCDELPNERALGVFWAVEQDYLGFSIEIKARPASRRGILSVVSSVYDPMGYVSPYALTAKILLQDLCRRRFEWDQDIYGNDLKVWQEWLDGLPRLHDIELPRCFKPVDFGEVTTVQLHVFSDASELGYGVVAYLRLLNTSSQVHVSFVMGKSRVAPLKKVTIPRMELTAATKAVKLSRLITNELEYPITDIHFWTDSMAVLRYIANDTTRFHTFVANRVNIIREASCIEQWKFIESRSNPADAASRGMKIEKFLRADNWFEGLNVLSKPESEWPQYPCGSVTTLETDDPEVKKVMSSALISEPCDGIEKLLCHYSDWTTLKRAVGWLLLVCKHLQSLAKMRKSQTATAGNMGSKQNVTTSRLMNDRKTEHSQTRLTLKVLEEAEKAIIRFVQWRHYPDIMNALHHKEDGLKKSALQKLDPMLHEGIMRVGGRLREADMSFDMKHPVILPKQSHVSSLILLDIHKSV